MTDNTILGNIYIAQENYLDLRETTTSCCKLHRYMVFGAARPKKFTARHRRMSQLAVIDHGFILVTEQS
jgi:hypothetical protein